ncbi:hypothetical protein [Roseinatronobacter sp. S2]|uniref:hypothetical protein n=1 Tax=Roseinatronobacter sp. S2 TaxID=3035471 RepID=UPI0024109918|nr:hypothetical protein [Roseinatronobacter sp. S2]WFE74241.1 hypothetical protein P8S53_13770 [Roseinatronobacter sp. S2]
MKWMLVILVMGGAPVKTGLTFDTLQDCLDAEDAARGEIAEAFNRWRDWAAANSEQSGYPESEPFMTRRIGMQNVATCIPHAPVQE